MTDRIGSSRRLILIGAALLAAAAVALILGVVPPVRSDTSFQSAAGSASAAFMVQAGIAFLVALVLVVVAVRADAGSRFATAILHLIGAVVFLLALVLAGPASTFLSHGPTLRVAAFLMFLCAAAECAATGMVVVAASRLATSVNGPAGSDLTTAWKMRVVPAAVLGLGSFFLTFLVGEGVKIPASVPAADYAVAFVVAMALGGYSLLATYVLLRGLPRAKRNLWIVLAMNAWLLITALIALLAEPNKPAALQILGVAIISSACSYGGVVLAGRSGGPGAVRDAVAG